MPPIDPRIVLAKRFPLHAAIDQCYFPQIRKLCEEDAEFHVVRKVQNYDTSIVHQACTLRGHQESSKDILHYIIEKGAPLNEKDSTGQTPLHYAASNPQLSKDLIPILISQGAQLDIQRSTDGWTPLHLAAMFGRLDIAGMLLAGGSDPEITDKDGLKPEDIARKHRFYALADILRSPRKEHRPGTLAPSESNESDILNLLTLTTKSELSSLKMKEKYSNWRDPEENSLLHLASWNGNLELCKWFFDSPRGRKLTSVQNQKGASPLALAIINGQTHVVEEFFMNKFSKNHIILDSNLKDSKENIAHLLIQYLPSVHSKFVLKRKDLTSEILNAVDANSGNSPLLHCATMGNRASIKRILSSKAVKEQQMLNLGLTNKQGKTFLHLLAENKDEANFRILLNDYNGLITPEIANLGDSEGDSCLIISLLRGSPFIVREILRHPNASSKFNLAYSKGGLSPLHLVAEQGNISLWNLAVAHPSCDLNARDPHGNTPLMTAAIQGNAKLLESWLQSPMAKESVELSTANNQGDTILSLFMKHIPESKSLASFIAAVNLRSILNQANSSSETPLSIAVQKERWEILKILLSHENLRNKKVGEEEDETEGVLDIHTSVPGTGLTALVSVLTAHVKLTRQVQTHNMKKQRVLAEECKKKCEDLWALVQLILLREKEMHGPTMVQGRDGGSACIKKQMNAGKLIRGPDQEQVISSYTKYYQFVKKKKPPPEVVKTNGKKNDSNKCDVTNKTTESKTKKSSSEKSKEPDSQISSSNKCDVTNKNTDSETRKSSPEKSKEGETPKTSSPKCDVTNKSTDSKTPSASSEKSKDAKEVPNGQTNGGSFHKESRTDQSVNVLPLETKKECLIKEGSSIAKKCDKLVENKIEIVDVVNGKTDTKKKLIEDIKLEMNKVEISCKETKTIQNEILKENPSNKEWDSSSRSKSSELSIPNGLNDHAPNRTDPIVESLISDYVEKESVKDDKFAAFLKSKMSVASELHDNGEVQTNGKEETSPTPAAPPRKQKASIKNVSTQTEDDSLKMCKCCCTCAALK